MAQITTFTGREWHTSYGAKAQVFVGKEETPIYQAPEAKLLDQEWMDIQRGKHGKWVEAIYEVPDGTIVKLFAISTWRGRPNGGGSAFFIVDNEAPVIIAQGEGYSDRIGTLEGPLRPIALDDLIEYGIEVAAKHRRYYKDKITVKEAS
jgi:hypothetical protein